MTITKGVYRGVEAPEMPTSTLTASISFECGGKSYTELTADQYVITYGETDAYEDGAGWVEENTDRRITVTADAEVSEDFYNWFTAAYDLWVYETEYAVKSAGLIATAEAIRAKTGGTGKIAWSNEKGFAEAVDGIGTGGGGGGEMAYNIAYGDTEPEDTSKLWVKTVEPAEVQISSDLSVAENSMELFGSALPSAAYNIGTAAVGTKIYLFGGQTGSRNSQSTINVFDTETNTIKTLSTTLPSSAYGIGAAAVGNKVYLFGGYSGSSISTIYVFDTETNTIKTLSTTLPSSAYGIGAAAVGTKIYLFGGSASSRLTTINVFDTKTNAITTLSATLPVSADYIGTAAVGTKIYLFGGSASSRLTTINVFDTETNTIKTLSTTLPDNTYNVGAAAVGNKVYLFGGFSLTGPLSTINVFDTETNTIKTLSTTLPTAAQGIGTAAVGNKIYLFGGLGGNASDYLSTINSFTIASELATNRLFMRLSQNENLFDLLPLVRIGVGGVYLGNAEGYAEKVNAYLHKVVSGVDYEWFYTSSAKETTSGTELTSSVACNVGDLVVAAIATRDTLTLSDGWTLVSTSEINSTDTAGNGQRLSWAWKFAESTTETITVTQASAQRLYINMVALQGATGVTDNGYTYLNAESASITADKPSGLVLWGATAPMWDTNTVHSLWTASNDMPLVQLGSDTQPRLAIGLDQSDDESVTFKPGSATSTLIVGSLTVQGVDKFYTATPFTRNEWNEI